jgi:Fur family peroxide stress response transcriptional regulator
MREQHPHSRAEAVALLRTARLRVTPQRLAIAEAVLEAHHPTAADLYAALQPRFPSMGLATVYTTLNTMAAHNLVRILPFQDAARYDTNMTPHANLVCTQCGRIDDLHECADLLGQLKNRAASRAAFQLEQERVDLFGICSDCREKKEPPSS